MAVIAYATGPLASYLRPNYSRCNVLYQHHDYECHIAEHAFSLVHSSVENGRRPSLGFCLASTFTGGELYTGLTADFLGRDSVILRSMGSRSPMRTETDQPLLHEPKFIAAHRIPDSEDPDDDKVYFFFSERADTGSHDGAIHTRVGRVCVNDAGGQRVLVNKWSSFIKARLVCSVPGPHGIDTHFDQLEDVFVLRTKDEKNPEIYAIFSSISAVAPRGLALAVTCPCWERAERCKESISRADGPTHQWGPYEGRVPYPRPGVCPSKLTAQPGLGHCSTLDFPDACCSACPPPPASCGRSVHPCRHSCCRAHTPHRSHITVDRTQADDGPYDVMFIGTDVGTVLKVLRPA
ncbi:hypothetical protein AALO_G00058370 [Alosa alosa]|uniref:Sema domain-containing protein n=1 Tax=Alosa alosa TaxID=278164 RepID=A0AAV6HA31_9TELE|nr:hypothetical protein AALO_G00058370 [Alosa alosa]